MATPLSMWWGHVFRYCGASALGLGVFLFDRISKMQAFEHGTAAIDQTILFFLPNSIFFTILLFVFCVTIIISLTHLNAVRLSSLGTSALALIAAGGLSNVNDRLLYGGVINYFSFAGLSYNIADAALLIGGGILIVLCFQKSTRER